MCERKDHGRVPFRGLRCFEEGLTLEKSASLPFYDGNMTLVNSFGSKFLSLEGLEETETFLGTTYSCHFLKRISQNSHTSVEM